MPGVFPVYSIVSACFHAEFHTQDYSHCSKIDFSQLQQVLSAIGATVNALVIGRHRMFGFQQEAFTALLVYLFDNKNVGFLWCH